MQIMNNYKLLIQKAFEAKRNALPTYSGFHVGAAISTDGNKIYKGCNIEISSYSLTICAERNAVFKAVSEGERKFKALALTSDSDNYCPPCGACLQVLMDLCEQELEIVMVNNKNEIKINKLKELLPVSFNSEILK